MSAVVQQSNAIICCQCHPVSAALVSLAVVNMCLFVHSFIHVCMCMSTSVCVFLPFIGNLYCSQAGLVVAGMFSACFLLVCSSNVSRPTA